MKTFKPPLPPRVLARVEGVSCPDFSLKLRQLKTEIWIEIRSCYPYSVWHITILTVVPESGRACTCPWFMSVPLVCCRSSNIFRPGVLCNLMNFFPESAYSAANFSRVDPAETSAGDLLRSLWVGCVFRTCRKLFGVRHYFGFNTTSPRTGVLHLCMVLPFRGWITVKIPPARNR